MYRNPTSAHDRPSPSTIAHGPWTAFEWNVSCIERDGGSRMFGILGWIIFGLVVGRAREVGDARQGSRRHHRHDAARHRWCGPWRVRRPRDWHVRPKRQRRYFHVDSGRRSRVVYLPLGDRKSQHNLVRQVRQVRWVRQCDGCDDCIRLTIAQSTAHPIANRQSQRNRTQSSPIAPIAPNASLASSYPHHVSPAARCARTTSGFSVMPSPGLLLT